MSFEELPDEIVYETLSYVEPAALSRFSRTSRYKTRFMEDERLLQQICRKYNREHSLDPLEYDRYTYGEKRDHVEDYRNGTFKYAFGENYKEAKRAIERCTGESLNLRLQDLKLLPREIGRLVQLRSLSLDGNRLASLPKEIGFLTRLQVLFLVDNKLRSLPEEIGQLSKIQELYLDNNELTSLPNEIGRLRYLQLLSLDKNKIASLPKEIGNLVRLHSLYLSDNELEELPREIGQLSMLRHLNVKNNRLVRLPDEIDQLARLKHLNFDEGTRLPEKTAVLVKYGVINRTGSLA